MKIAAFIGSGNKNGNTAKLIKQILKGAESKGATWEIFYLCDYNIKPCTGCRYCEKTNVCKITDDDIPVLHKAILEDDAFILGTPTYYGDISGVFKQFVDRCYPFCTQLINKETRKCSFGSILPKRKPGILVATSGGMGPEVFERHSSVAHHCFNDINANYWRKLLVPYTSFDEVTSDHQIMEYAFRTGVELVTVHEPGALESGIEFEHEYDINTED